MSGNFNWDRYEFINLISDGVILLENNAIIAINPEAARILGVEGLDLVNKEIDTCVKFVDKHYQDIYKAYTDGKKNFYTIIRTKAEELIKVDLSFAALNENIDMMIIKRYSQQEQTIYDMEAGYKSCNQWHKELIDFMPDALFVTLHGRFIFANKSAAKLLEIDFIEDLLGRNIIEYLDPESYIDHQHTVTEVIHNNKKTLVTERKIITEKRNEIEVEIISSAFIYKGEEVIISLVRDITKRKIAEKSLRESEERYSKLVELCPDGIFIIDDHKIAFSNKAGAELLNAPNTECLNGRHFMEFAHPDFIKLMQKRVADVYQNNVEAQCAIQNKMIAMDGTVKDIEVVNVDFLYKGKKMLLNVVRDITSRKKTEEDNKRLQEALAYDNLKTEFFSNLSHELKTPLNILLGTLQLINATHKNSVPCTQYEKFKQYFRIMKQNCYRLLRLINNLIDITRIDSGFLQMKFVNGDIIKLVEDIVASVEEYTKLKGIELTMYKQINEKHMAFDPDKLERVVLNLLSNAIKFNKQDGEIKVYIKEMDEKLYISVKDTGVGIPADMLDKVFERFRQVDDLFTRKTEGSGIGLSLVKSLVEGHGGIIRVESTLGVGSEFTVELPITLAAEEHEMIKGNFERHEKVERINIEFSDIYTY